jgi:hypothetical protein
MDVAEKLQVVFPMRQGSARANQPLKELLRLLLPRLEWKVGGGAALGCCTGPGCAAAALLLHCQQPLLHWPMSPPAARPAALGLTWGPPCRPPAQGRMPAINLVAGKLWQLLQKARSEGQAFTPAQPAPDPLSSHSGRPAARAPRAPTSSSGPKRKHSAEAPQAAAAPSPATPSLLPSVPKSLQAPGSPKCALVACRMGPSPPQAAQARLPARSLACAAPTAGCRPCQVSPLPWLSTSCALRIPPRRPRPPVPSLSSLGSYELRHQYACCACCEAKLHLGCLAPEQQHAVLTREPLFCGPDCAAVSKQLAEMCGRGMMKVRQGRGEGGGLKGGCLAAWLPGWS